MRKVVETTGTGAEDGALRDRLFLIMWATAHIVHLVNHTGGQFTTVTGSATLLVAVLAIRFSADARWLVCLAVLQLADVAWELPSSPDHWNLVAVVNVAILLTWLTRRDTSTLVVRAAPAIRLVAMLGYSAAAIAKWNLSFLDPETSCGVALAHIATLSVTESIPQFDIAHIGFSLAAESMIAVGLIVPRFRRVGALLGMGFHFLVSLSPAMLVADFTVTLFALFVLFLPPSQRTELAQVLKARVNQFSSVPHGQLVLFVVFAGGVLGFGSTFAARTVLWISVTTYGISLLRAAFRTRAVGATERAALGRVGAPAALASMLILALALNPYVGGRTTGVFTMFSNLRTEGPGTNHLFMPSLDAVDWQNDLVPLTGSTSATIDMWADEDLSLPRLDIARRVHDDADLIIEARLKDDGIVFGPNGQGIEEPSWFISNFTTFRGIAEQGPNVCSG